MEDKTHFLLKCPSLANVGKSYIDKLILKLINLSQFIDADRFIRILSSEDEMVCHTLKFVTFFFSKDAQTTKEFITTKTNMLKTDYKIFIDWSCLSLIVNTFSKYKQCNIYNTFFFFFLYLIFPNKTIIEQLYLCFFINLLFLYLIHVLIIWAP